MFNADTMCLTRDLQAAVGAQRGRWGGGWGRRPSGVGGEEDAVSSLSMGLVWMIFRRLRPIDVGGRKTELFTPHVYTILQIAGQCRLAQTNSTRQAITSLPTETFLPTSSHC